MYDDDFDGGYDPWDAEPDYERFEKEQLAQDYDLGEGKDDYYDWNEDEIDDEDYDESGWEDDGRYDE